jgi:glycosyltransferase involved in cell wall biosynthesis
VAKEQVIELQRKNIKKKEISVVMPTIGRENYIDIAIESLLSQDTLFDEIIIFDNSIAQNLKEISIFCDNPFIRWEKSGKHVNVIDSCNNAVKYATKEFVTIMGDDDILYKHFVFEAKKLIDSGYSMILLPFLFCNNNGDTLSLFKNSQLFHSITSTLFRAKRMEGKFEMMLPGVIFKKNNFNKVCGFESTRFPNNIYSDEFMWFKLSLLEDEIGCSDRVCWSYRIHSGQFVNVTDASGFITGTDNYIDMLCNSFKTYSTGSIGYFDNDITKDKYRKNIILYRYHITQKACIKRLYVLQFVKNLYYLLFYSKISFFWLIKMHAEYILKKILFMN